MVCRLIGRMNGVFGCINEDGLPSAAIRFAADRGVIRDGAPNTKEGSPMEQYAVGLDVHSRQSAFVIEEPDGQVIARGEVPTDLPPKSADSLCC